MYWWEGDIEVTHIIIAAPRWHFMFSSVCFMKLGALIYGEYILTTIISLFSFFYCLYIYSYVYTSFGPHYIFLIHYSLYKYVVTFFISSDWSWLEVYFVRCEYSYSCLLSDSICIEYHFPLFQFQSVCMSLQVRWVSWSQQIVGFFFSFLSFFFFFKSSLHLLTREW
jgi:hypothetical protein